MPKKKRKRQGPTPPRKPRAAPRPPSKGDYVPGSVVISYLHPGTVESAFHESVINSFTFDALEGCNHLWNGGGKISISSGANITRGRNAAVRRFLDETNAEWLWIVDSDMVWKPDALEQLVHNADKDERPFIGGLCFGQKAPMEDPSLGMAPFPTLFFMGENGKTFMSWEYPEDTLYEVDATGAAFLLVHRTLLQKMRDKYEEARAPFTWFAEEVVAGKHFSEDIVFCLRAKTCGAPVLVHTGVKVGHVKPRILEEREYLEWWAKAKPKLEEGQDATPQEWWASFNKAEEE